MIQFFFLYGVSGGIDGMVRSAPVGYK